MTLVATYVGSSLVAIGMAVVLSKFLRHDFDTPGLPAGLFGIAAGVFGIGFGYSSDLIMIIGLLGAIPFGFINAQELFNQAELIRRKRL